MINPFAAANDAGHPGPERVFTCTGTEGTFFHGFFHFNLARAVANKAM